MRKIGLILLLFIQVTAFAQGKLTDEKRKEFEAQKVAFYTQQLDLTPDEAAVFWPLYNEMRKKIGEVESGMRKKNAQMKTNKGLKEEDYKAAVVEMLENGQKITAIKKTYYLKMLQSLPASKLWKLEQAEHKFHRQLFDKLRRESHPKK